MATPEPPPPPAGDPRAPEREGAKEEEDWAALPHPDDPHFFLYSKRLEFGSGGPRVPVRLMEGASEVRFSPRARMRMRLFGAVEKQLDAPANSAWTVRVLEGQPAQIRRWLVLADLPLEDAEGLATQERKWRARGLGIRQLTIGSLYGIRGKVLNNRRALLLLDEALEPGALEKRQAELLARFQAKTTVHEELLARPRAILEVLDASGNSMGLSQDLAIAETDGGAGFSVQAVEHDVGYPAHGFENRSYRGVLELAADRSGKIALVNVVPLEQLLKGLVPAEIYAAAHPEALKAQAITARGEVLAKIGLRHLADPYQLCSEQHCAVYRGRSGEAASATAAVEDTAGLCLFSPSGRLVNAVFSAVCGGHTENNEAVWGGSADPSLRGRPDVLPGKKAAVGPDTLPAFLRQEAPAACRLASLSNPSKFRWKKRMTAEELKARTSSLGIGTVRAIAVRERGASGRAKSLSLRGDKGSHDIQGELNIRRFFGMLNSSMFLVSAERGKKGEVVAWQFEGGGWGHGVGLCQMGAIGRAEAGQSHEDILRHYFNGASVQPLYEK